MIRSSALMVVVSLFQTFPHSARAFSPNPTQFWQFSDHLRMASTSRPNLKDSAAQECTPTHQELYKPVHIYPYSLDMSHIQSSNNGDYSALKRFHVVRHAEGTHNVNRQYRDIVNLDARLTDLGKEQCRTLAQQLVESHNALPPKPNNEIAHHHCLLENTELVVTSPLTRCMQTAMLSFPVLTNAKEQGGFKVPFVAHESIRETVNYTCDRRRAISELEAEFHDRICFKEMEHDHDEIWESYIRRVGSTDEFNTHRESAELHIVAQRAKKFFSWIKERPEKEVVVCTHSAFLRCFLNWGQSGGVPMMMKQTLDQRENRHGQELPVLRFCGDASFEESMRRDYDNCELRSFVVAFP